MIATVRPKGSDRLRLLILLTFVSILGCQAKDMNLGASGDGKLLDKQINDLIDSLASHYEKPNVDSRERVPAEPAIWRAVDELIAIGPRAFPLLIDHFDDERFSFTEDCVSCERSENPVFKRTVGHLCYMIVRSQVQRYESWEGPDPRDSPGYSECVVPHEKERAVQWLQSSAGKSLWEMQYDNIRFVILENHKMLEKQTMTQNDRDLCIEAIAKNEELLELLKVNRSHLLTKPIRPSSDR